MAKTQRERDDEARKAKLEHIDEQVQQGSLTIRTMSDEERAAWAKKRAASAGDPMSPAEKRKAAAAERRRARRASSRAS